MRKRRLRLFHKFFADRGPHLAAMIAYFALLSFVPLTFLALSLLGLAGRANESSFLVTELKRALPAVPIEKIAHLVQTVQHNATALASIGGAFLLWTSLSLFSVLESAFNIVYGRPNRSFLHGKAIAIVLMVGSLVTLFVALLVGSIGAEVLDRYAPGFIASPYVAYTLSVLVSMVGVFVFLASSYYALTNVHQRLRDVIPGALFATVLLEASFQVLPTFIRVTQLNPTLQVFGGPVLLLVWLYVMANVIVLGAEINWWRTHRAEEPEDVPGLA